METFKDYKGYSVGSKGTVLKRADNSTIKPFLSGKDSNYLRVNLNHEGQRTKMLVHHLVLLVHSEFSPLEEDTGDHRDENTLNNCITNLRWLSRSRQ